MSYKLYPSHKIHDLREMLDESARRYPMRPAFLQKKDGFYHAYTYIRLKTDTDALGTALAHRGFADAKIMILGENCYAWCLSYLSVVTGLGVVVPTDKEIPAEDLAHIAEVSEASLILYSAKCEAKLEKLGDSVEKICFDDLPDLIGEGQDLLSEGNRAFLDRSIDIDALCSLIFTSGTTGASKGVMLSQRNICHTIENLGKMVYVTPEDRALSVLPLHHVYECTCGFLYPLSCGASVAFSEGVRHIMRNMKEVTPTKMLCVPMLLETMYRKIWANIRKKGLEAKVQNLIRLTNKIQPESARLAMKKKVFSDIHESFGGRLNLLISGGAPIDPEVLRGLREFGIPVIQGYGLTEAAPLAAVNHDSFFNDRSAGLCLPTGELKILHPAEDGTGEICYRGDNVMMGYYQNPELTAEVKKNGWLHTGDIGLIDRRGFLIITGRKKNVIVKSNGKNVFPEELEAILSRHPLVGEVAVLGIHNEKKNDYDLVAVIVPNAEAVRAENLSEDEVQKSLEAWLSSVNTTVQTYKRIDVLLIRSEELPKNSSKKVKRFELPELIMEDYLQKNR